jgi:hypothetical protein
MKKFAKFIWLFCFLCINFDAFTQHRDSVSHSLMSLGLSAHTGFIFAHSQDVQNTDGSYPFGIQLDWNFHKRNQQSWDACYCYPRTGFVFQYFNYDNNILGSSIHAGGFIEPYFNYRNRFTFSLKAIAGMAYLTNPYHPSKNPSNMSYSLAVSGFISLGVGSHVRLSDRFSLHAYATYNHISNGGIKEPNKGINWPTASLGFDYALEPVVFPVREKTRYKTYKGKPPRTDVAVFLSSKTVQAGEKDRWLIGGIAGQISKQVSIFNALSLGSEIWFDNALQEKLNRAGQSQISSWRAGVLAGNEFLMGRFVFSQQMGFYVYKPAPYFNALYQRYGLIYRFNNHIAMGVNLLAHGHVANFLDFRCVYSLNGK